MQVTDLRTVQVDLNASPLDVLKLIPEFAADDVADVDRVARARHFVVGCTAVRGPDNLQQSGLAT